MDKLIQMKSSEFSDEGRIKFVPSQDPRSLLWPSVLPVYKTLQPLPQQSEHSRYNIWPSRLDCPQSIKEVGFNVSILPIDLDSFSLTFTGLVISKCPLKWGGQNWAQKCNVSWQKQCSNWPSEKKSGMRSCPVLSTMMNEGLGEWTGDLLFNGG